MVYTKHSWREKAGTTGGGGQRETWLNNLETQYDEVVTYYTTTLHDASYYTEAEMVAMPFYNPTIDGTGSGFVAETLDGYSAATIIGAQVATGTVLIWGSSAASIPSGWHLCDGRDANTPDLRGKFPTAAGTSYVLGATGGAATVSGTVSAVTIAGHALTTADIPGHQHTGPIDYVDNVAGGNQSYAASNGADVATSVWTGAAGSSAAHGHPGSSVAAGQGGVGNNLPAYRAYCYIIKE